MAAASVVGSPVLEAALRKARWRLIPLLAVGYLIAYMDRSNISYAAESMNRQLHFSAHVYGLGAGLFFVSYALCEVPSNALLLRFGARRWLARILLTWGVLAAAMMLVRTAPSFYGVRLLLGCAEAGYFPGVIYYLSRWFPTPERARAISWFYISLPLSIVLMGLVAGSLLHLDGRLGLRGWQWLFLVEGLPAVLMSLWFWMALPDSPATAEWLSAEEREALRTELVRDSPEHGSSADLKQVLLEPRVWVLGLFAFCMLGMNYAVSYFLPLMLNGIMHWSAEKTGYCIAAGGVAAAVAMVAGAAHSDRTGERRWHIVVPMLIGGGLALLAALVAGRPGGALPAALAQLLFLVPYCAMQGPMLVMASKLCPGKNAALAVAVFNMCGICGGFVGPYWMGWMRELMGGYATGLGSLCVPSVVGAGCILWLTKGRE